MSPLYKAPFRKEMEAHQEKMPTPFHPSASEAGNIAAPQAQLCLHQQFPKTFPLDLKVAGNAGSA